MIDLQLIDRKIRAGLRRDQHQAGRIEKRRGVHGSKPVFAGTRIPVDTVRRYLEAGRSVDQVLESFPALTKADVEIVRATTAA